MTTDYINPASNLSYVSKDFQTIFPDLLNLTKELSSRWDPSISNEADPGVVLVKLNAIIADKLNYNIDKNILEAFPMSLTQMGSARKIYNMLGYKMAWYKSAETVVTLTWTEESEDTTAYVRIPAFTMIADDSSSLIYSIIQTCDSTDTEVSVDQLRPASDMKLYYGNDPALTVKAVQGIAINYNINGEEVIKAGDLDSENRIYFSTTDVAENGVFICNDADEENRVYDWNRVDNLLIQKLGEKNFEFGITDDGYSCYVEFPEDAEDLIKDGIRIVYLSTSGVTGNVAANTLNKFYTDTYLTDSTGTSITLSSANTTIANSSAAVGGADPETINAAYKAYKKIVGTFDTLITLRDYLNAILTSDLVSNAFVCDKTNDIQCSYIVKSIINGVDTDRVYIENLADGNEKTIGSLNIKLYLLQKVNSMNQSTFSASFDLLPDNQQENVKAYLNTKKHIGHDYSTLLTTTTKPGQVHPCLFINKYIVTARVQCISDYTEAIKKDIKANIIQTLCDSLNAAEISFSETITTDRIKQIIESADARIKNAVIENLDYTTYGRYYRSSIKCTNVITKEVLSKTHTQTSDGKKVQKLTCDDTIYDIIKLSYKTATSLEEEIPKTKYNYDSTTKEITFDNTIIPPKNSTISVLYTMKNTYTTDTECGHYLTKDMYNMLDGICPYCGGHIEWTEDDDIYNPPVYDFVELPIGHRDDTITDSINNLISYSAQDYSLEQQQGYKKGDLVIYNGKRYRCELDGASVIPYAASNVWKLDEYKFDVDYSVFVKKLTDLSATDIPSGGALDYDTPIIITRTNPESGETKPWALDYTGLFTYYGDGETKIFTIPTWITSIKNIVIDDTVLEPENDYQFNKTNSTITFIEIPDLGAEIKIEANSSKTYTDEELTTEFGIKRTAGTLQYNKYRPYGNKGDKIIFYISKATQIRDEVYTKAILAGTTALIEDDETAMDFNFTNPYSKTYSAIQKISGETTIPLLATSSYTETLNANEVVEFYAPDFYEITNYSSYVKFEAKLNQNIKANANVQLKDGEYIVFYYRPTDNASGTYQYHAYGKGTVINSSIELSKDITPMLAQDILPEFTSWKATTIGGHTYYEAYTAYNGQMTLENSEKVANELTSTNYILNSDTKKIQIKGPSQITLNNSFCCYWILNNNSDTAVLFEDGQATRILGNGEYFMYSSLKDLNNMEVLGQGTKITRTNTTGALSVPANLTYVDVLEKGFLGISSGNTYIPITELTCTKNQAVYLGEGCQIRLVPKETLDTTEYGKIYIKADGVYRYSALKGEIIYDPTALLKFTISYNNQSETDFPNELEYIAYQQKVENVTTTVGWEALSILQLNMSKTSGQALYTNQSVHLKNATYQEITDPTDPSKKIVTGLITINGEDARVFSIDEIADSAQQLYSRAYKFNYLPCKLFSDIDIYLSNVGDYTLYTTYTEDDETKIKYGTITKAKTNALSNITAVSPLTNGSVVLSITKTESKEKATHGGDSFNFNAVLYPISLAAGNYLTKVTSSSTELDEVVLYLNKYKEESFDCTKAKYEFETKLKSEPPFILLDNVDIRETEYADKYTLLHEITESPDIITGIEFSKVPTKTEGTVKMRVAFNKFTEIENSTFVIASTETANLNAIINTPVKFTIPEEYDPESYVLPLFLTAKVKLKSTLSVLSNTETITLSNPKKYVKCSDLTTLEYEKYGELLKILDRVDGPTFNYMYEIKENELIREPLTPTGFLNLNHPFYAYTICELVSTNMDGVELFGEN